MEVFTATVTEQFSRSHFLRQCDDATLRSLDGREE